MSLKHILFHFAMEPQAKPIVEVYFPRSLLFFKDKVHVHEVNKMSSE